jgi:hypothetical protein
MAKDKRVVPLRLIKSMEDYETNVHPKLRKYNYVQFHDPYNEEWDMLKGFLDTGLAEDETPDAVKQAVKGLDSHQKSERFEAIKSLEDYDHPAATRALQDAINHSFPDVVMKAGLALTRKSEFKEKAAIQGLGRCAREAGHSDRETAVRYLGRMNCLESAQELAESLPNLKNMVSTVISDVIQAFSNQDVAPVLRTLADDKTKDAWLRHACLLKLAHFRDTESIPIMVAYLDALARNQRIRANQAENEAEMLETFLRYDPDDIRETVGRLMLCYTQRDNFHFSQSYKLTNQFLIENGDNDTREQLNEAIMTGITGNRKSAIVTLTNRIEHRLRLE